MASSQVIEIELGPEWDAGLLSRLHATVVSAGGAMKNVSWGVGGSQEVTSYRIQLPDGEIEAEAQTYMGLVLRGRPELVEPLVRAIKSCEI